jgi:serpin B
MKKIATSLLVLVILSGLLGCQKPVNEEKTSTEVEITDAEILSRGNNTFAWDLYHYLNSVEGNLFYSPYSISQALAMTYTGARGNTEQQMADTLHFKLNQGDLHPTFANLSQLLASRENGTASQDNKGFILRNANALWGQKDYSFKTEFLDGLETNYQAGLKQMDFTQAPEESRMTINEWVAQQTEEKIKDLIPPGGLTLATRLVLTNAIYFKADWLKQFNSDFTSDGEFNLLNGSKVTVPMMKQIERFGYTSGNNYQAVELPYEGQELSMVILLPAKGQFTKFEVALNNTKLQDILDGLLDEQPANRKISLVMPQFKFTSDFGLKKVLSTLGMPEAFDPGTADFTGMTDEGPLWIDDVIHKAFIAVDEYGTEAAAATAVIMVGSAQMNYEIVEFTMDRPFIFLIRDIETDTTLFLGRVVNPLE